MAAGKLVKGGFQRGIQTALYALLFCCSAIILGLYSYFLSILADRNQPIANWKKAVEGIAGAAVLYTAFAVILTCCLAGIRVFSFLALLLDLLFAGGMIAIAYMTRQGAKSCVGEVKTPIGSGSSDSNSGFGPSGIGTDSGENLTYSVDLGTACQFNKVSFAVSLIAAILFICTAIMQVFLVRHHKKEKRYGPSPDNNYTSGAGKTRFGMFGKKKNRNSDAPTAAGTDHNNAENGRSSYDKRDTNGTTGTGHGGYHTQPTGTEASNPYGYNQTSTNY